MAITTKLSSKGQIVIPKEVRKALKWKPGLRLEVIDTGNGVVLRPLRPVPKTNIKEVAGCLKYSGKAKTIADMEKAIRIGAQKQKANGSS